MTLSRRALFALGLAVAIQGCGRASASDNALVLVVGARANSVRPTLVDDIATTVLDAAARDTVCTVIVADGAPFVAETIHLHSTAANALATERERQTLLTRASTAIASCRARAPEVDQLAALALAERAVSAARGTRQIVMIDSLLQTAGGLRFQDSGGASLSASPDGLADQLAVAKFLPDLRGVDVRLLGVGDVTPPQPAIGEPARQSLTAIWSAIVLRANGSVSVLPAPLRAGLAIPDLPPVSVVPVQQPPPAGGPLSEPVRLGDSSVGFLPDQAVFRDPDQARLALAPYIAALTGSNQRVRLTGTTSSAGTPAGRIQLSLDRVRLVRDVLVQGGVDPAAVDVRGAGSDFPGLVPDRDSSGRLDPVLAARNRQVIIEPMAG